MTRYFVAPEYSPAPAKSVFLAGGITDCPDWQSFAARRLLAETYPPTIVYNPRRVDWDQLEDDAFEEQVRWEHHHLKQATCLLFWFCKETVQPISLLEYGVCLRDPRPLFVGIEQGYERADDLRLQTKLYRPQQTIHQWIGYTIDAAVTYLNAPYR